MNGFEVEKYISPLHNLNLYENIDPDILTKLIQSDLLLETVKGTNEYSNEKAMLMAYKKKIKDGKVKVKYSYTEKIKYGRVYPQRSLSLACFRKAIRHTLAKEYYVDIDIENCHPVILYQLCKKNYIESGKYQYLKKYVHDRESCLEEVMEEYSVDRKFAKGLFLRLLYFGKFEGWCKDKSIKNNKPLEFISLFTKELNKLGDIILKSNPDLSELLSGRPNIKGSVCSYMLQEYERRILESVYNYLSETIKTDAVLCFDGIMIPKKLYNDEMLKELKNIVKEELGFRVNFVIKDMDEDFLKELGEIKIIEIDDRYAAERFIYLLEGKIFKQDDVLYIFNDNNGIWETGDSDLIRYICGNLKQDMIFNEMIGTKIVKHNYSGSARKQDGMIKMVNRLVKNSKTLHKMRKTAARKLLFEDGIFDMDTFEFTTEFDPKILFLSSIPYKFKEILETPNEETIAEIQLKLFEQPFSLNLDYGRYFKQYIARALALDYHIKKCLFGIGNTNSSKGTITGCLRATFGSYVGEWDGNNLKFHPNDSRDEALKLKFLAGFQGKRLMIGNEMNQIDGNKIDSTIIKKICSGGDDLTIRKLYCNDMSFVNQALPLILANDMPEVLPLDDAVLERLRYMRFTTNFVKGEPKNSSEMKIDEKFKDKLSEDDSFINGMFWVIMRCWCDEVMNKPYWEPDCIIEETKEWIDEKDLMSILRNSFDITNDETDYVIFSNIREEAKCLKLSDVKLGRELTKLGFISKTIRENNKTYKSRVGLRLRE